MAGYFESQKGGDIFRISHGYTHAQYSKHGQTLHIIENGGSTSQGSSQRMVDHSSFYGKFTLMWSEECVKYALVSKPPSFFDFFIFLFD